MPLIRVIDNSISPCQKVLIQVLKEPKLNNGGQRNDAHVPQKGFCAF